MTMESLLTPPNPHEAFSLMLLERLEHLEEKCQMLQKEIFNKKHYPFYTYEFKVHFIEKYSLDISKTIHSYINAIMEKRSIFLPVFAFWKYDVYQDKDPESYYSVYFTMYVHTNESVTHYQFEQWLLSTNVQVCPIPGSLYTLKLLLKQYMAWHITLPYLNEDHKIEIWKKGGLFFEELNTNMTQEPFIQSSNYVASQTLQQDFFQMIKQRDWAELFHD